MDILDNNDTEETTQYKPAFEPPMPFTILLTCFGIFILGNIVGGAAMLGLAQIMGLDINIVLKGIDENAPVATRNFMRAVLFLNHLFLFILPAALTAFIFYKKPWVSYLRLKRAPNGLTVALASVWLLVAMPLVQFSLMVNKMLPLPSWAMSMEADTSRLLAGILTKSSWYEAVINVFIIAAVPALGEEMMFRGILQQQIGRVLKNEHAQVWVSAAIFSAIHFQFQGFFARMILGALLGYLLVWSRNLWLPIVVHFLNNGVQIVALYATNMKPSEVEKLGDLEKLSLSTAFSMALISLAATIFIGNMIRNRTYTEGSV